MQPLKLHRMASLVILADSPGAAVGMQNASPAHKAHHFKCPGLTNREDLVTLPCDRGASL